MNCPLCNVNLQMTDRQGVEIDYCPKCRGIWLDRGELEKLVELSVAQTRTAMPPAEPSEAGGRFDHYADRRDESRRRGSKQKKKESWLSSLLDFD